MPIPFEFDFLKPDYTRVFEWRRQRLQWLRQNPDKLPKIIGYYRLNPVDFIADWGMTFDPRNVEIGLPAKLPFVLFPKQTEWLHWVLDRWHARERGMTEKSRGEGVSWLAVSLSVTLCLFRTGMTIGFGSRKAEYVDRLGDLKALFPKARMFLEMLPVEFRFGWNAAKHSRENLLLFPQTESSMSGEAGGSIGRGNRTSLYFVDEAAFLEHQEDCEAALSDTTNCRIDISTPNGSLNAFYDRRMALPKHQIFTLSWRDDPRRDKAWEEKKRKEIAPAVFDAEYDLRYDEGGSFFAEQSFLVEGQPVEMPPLCDYVVAIIDTAVKTGKQHDGVAVSYYARCKNVAGHPLVMLDWDYKQIEGALLEVWLPQVFEYLEKLAAECHAIHGSLGAQIEDKSSGMVLLQQAVNKGWPATAIDSKLTALGKSERAINASGPTHRGEVKMSRRAYERTVDFKGVTKNHMLMQILGFRAGNQDDVQDDCLDTYTYAVALTLGGPEGF